MELPRYFIVGIRPVKLVATPEGGMDCLAFDWSTGALVRNFDHFEQVVLPTGGDLEQVTEAEFEAAVARLRQERGLSAPQGA